MRTPMIIIGRVAMSIVLLTQIAFSIAGIAITMPSFTPCGPHEGLDFCHNDWRAVDVEIIFASLAGIASNAIPWYYAERWLKRNPEAFTHRESDSGAAEPFPRWIVIAGRSVFTLAIGVFLVQPIIMNVVQLRFSPICPSVYVTDDYPVQACASSGGSAQHIAFLEKEIAILVIVLGAWIIGERQMRKSGLIRS